MSCRLNIALSRITPVLLTALCLCGVSPAAERPDVNAMLQEGDLAEADAALTELLRENNDDDLARFQLGTVRFLRAIEQMAHNGAELGPRDITNYIPFLRVAGIAADKNNDKDKAPHVEYEDVRRVLSKFQKAIAHAEQTLAPIQSKNLKWDLDLGSVAIDFNNDGKVDRREGLDPLIRRVMNRRLRNEPAVLMVVGFDSADAKWLQGYCHALMAMLDMTLAYDHQELFDLTAHTFFMNAQTDFARKRDDHNHAGPGTKTIDAIYDIAGVLRGSVFKLREPQRLRDAHAHLLAMIKLSRENWKLIDAETDDHNEWIPSAKQKSTVTALQVDQGRIDAWHAFLDEAEDVLRGKKLVPFWRVGFKKGVNLERVFSDPRDFDMLLWIQGTAALPYLEEGELSRPETWRELMRVFRGDFFGFAMWVN